METTEIKDYKDLNIKPVGKVLAGDRISAKKLFGKQIIIYWFTIEDTKLTDATNPKCAWVQIEFNNEKRVLFTSSKYLMDALEDAKSKNGFPLRTTIVEIDGRFEFR